MILPWTIDHDHGFAPGRGIDRKRRVVRLRENRRIEKQMPRRRLACPGGDERSDGGENESAGEIKTRTKRHGGDPG